MNDLDPGAGRAPYYQPSDNLDGKTVLVTGGTGSFGRQFVATLLQRYQAHKIIVFSRDEAKQYDMAHALAEHSNRLRFFIGDVRDVDRLTMAMRETDVVVHAAALKHVPAAEYNPFECICTNVHGAENVVRAALNCGVGRVIGLSTDKAANPINLYGASKLAADKIFVAANNLSGSIGTRFSVVRYGNVIGSRGSIVLLFRRLIAEGAEYLPITDARMTRFWLTLQRGVDFVLSCLATMQGGEIFVPKCPSMRIVDVAGALAPDMEQRVIGIRPGEKLHEVLITEDDSRNTLEVRDRYLIEPQFAFWQQGAHDEAGATPVADGFRYDSESNPERLDRAAFLAMLADADRELVG